MRESDLGSREMIQLLALPKLPYMQAWIAWGIRRLALRGNSQAEMVIGRFSRRRDSRSSGSHKEIRGRDAREIRRDAAGISSGRSSRSPREGYSGIAHDIPLSRDATRSEAWLSEMAA